MSKKFKITALAFVILIVPLILIIFYSLQIKHLRDNFYFVETNQSKQTVTDLMGEPSSVRKCNFPIHGANKKYFGNCSEIYTYHGITEKWAVAFDNNGNVIEKYNWFLGEYGKRPPDVN